MRLLLPASSLVTLFLFACGGDVVVDEGPAGTGGGSASTASGPSTGAQGPDVASAGPAPVAGPGPNGTTGPGPGQGPGPSVTTGPGPDPQCVECVSALPPGSCQGFVDKCVQQQECVDLVECHLECDFEEACVVSCDQQHPSGTNLGYAVLQCAICDNCFQQCADSATNTYCFFEGG